MSQLAFNEIVLLLILVFASGFGSIDRAHAQPSQTCNGVAVPSWTTASRPSGAVNGGTTGFNLTTGVCESYVPSVASWIAATITGAINALPAGADPTGNLDSAPAVNAAALTGNSIYLPAGSYTLSHMVSLANGQCLFGDARGNTSLNVYSSFDPTAAAVIQLAGTQDTGPCLHDLTINFAVPNIDAVTRAAAGSAVAATTITVVSTANILLNGSVTDATTAAAIPSLTTVTAIAGNVLTISKPVASPGVGSGDSLHFGPSRATFKTLAAGCTTGVGGTGCKYPPAVNPISDSVRYQLYRVKIQGAWDAIVSEVNSVMWLDDIEVSALDKGLAWDDTVTVGTLDVGHVHGFHFWNFGMTSSSNLYSQVFADGNTFATSLGEIDGIEVVDFFTHRGRLHLTPNFSYGQFSGVELDTSATMEITGSVLNGIQVTALSSNGIADPANSHCMLDIAGGVVTVAGLIQPTSTTPGVCVSGGSVNITGGVENPNVPAGKSIVQTGGQLTVSGMQFALNTGAGAWTVPVVSSTGSLTFVGNTFLQVSIGDVGGVVVTGDSALNNVSGNTFNGWGFTPPGTLGLYGPNSNSLSCSGTPTAGFAATHGVVTHC